MVRPIPFLNGGSHEPFSQIHSPPCFLFRCVLSLRNCTGRYIRLRLTFNRDAHVPSLVGISFGAIANSWLNASAMVCHTHLSGPIPLYNRTF